MWPDYLEVLYPKLLLEHLNSINESISEQIFIYFYYLYCKHRMNNDLQYHYHHTIVIRKIPLKKSKVYFPFKASIDWRNHREALTITLKQHVGQLWWGKERCAKNLHMLKKEEKLAKLFSGSGFLKIIRVGILTYAGMKNWFLGLASVWKLVFMPAQVRTPTEIIFKKPPWEGGGEIAKFTTLRPRPPAASSWPSCSRGRSCWPPSVSACSAGPAVLCSGGGGRKMGDNQTRSY